MCPETDDRAARTDAAPMTFTAAELAAMREHSCYTLAELDAWLWHRHGSLPQTPLAHAPTATGFAQIYTNPDGSGEHIVIRYPAGARADALCVTAGEPGHCRAVYDATTGACPQPRRRAGRGARRRIRRAARALRLTA
jgi:hypothetical protein